MWSPLTERLAIKWPGSWVAGHRPSMTAERTEARASGIHLRRIRYPVILECGLAVCQPVTHRQTAGKECGLAVCQPVTHRQTTGKECGLVVCQPVTHGQTDSK